VQVTHSITIVVTKAIEGEKGGEPKLEKETRTKESKGMGTLGGKFLREKDTVTKLGGKRQWKEKKTFQRKEVITPSRDGNERGEWWWGGCVFWTLSHHEKEEGYAEDFKGNPERRGRGIGGDRLTRVHETGALKIDVTREGKFFTKGAVSSKSKSKSFPEGSFHSKKDTWS